MSPPIHKGCVRLLGSTFLLTALCGGPISAQTDEGATSSPPVAQPPTADSLGRDTPQTMLLGFMRAARSGNDEAAALYLNTPLQGEAAKTLARKLYVVLDSRLPAQLAEVSNHPEGSRANPLKPDQDVVGTIASADGELNLIVERVRRGAQTQPIWLFSQRTLSEIPRVYDEIDLISLDNYLPAAVATPSIGGIRVFEWLILCIVVPLSYRMMGLTGLPGPIRLLILAVSIRWLLASLDLPLRERQLWTTASALLAMGAGAWLLLSASAYGERYARQRCRDANLAEVSSLVRLGRRFADALACLAVGLVVLSYFGVDPTAALAGLGIGGIAVALAAQKTLENVIGGLSLIFDGAVRVGDYLKLGEAEGTVDSIGLRSTRIRTLDRTIISMPNGQVANASIETLSARDMCWFHHIVGVRYETTSAQIRYVIDSIRERLAADPAVDKQFLRVRLLRLGPSSLDIEVFAYVLSSDWAHFLELQERLLILIFEVIEGTGAAIAYPTQTLRASSGSAHHSLSTPVKRPTPAIDVAASRSTRLWA